MPYPPNHLLPIAPAAILSISQNPGISQLRSKFLCQNRDPSSRCVLKPWAILAATPICSSKVPCMIVFSAALLCGIGDTGGRCGSSSSVNSADRGGSRWMSNGAESSSRLLGLVSRRRGRTRVRCSRFWEVAGERGTERRGRASRSMEKIISSSVDEFRYMSVSPSSFVEATSGAYEARWRRRWRDLTAVE